MVSVGRVPADSSDAVRGFVDKLIAYESYAGMPAGFGRRALLGSSNWAGGPGVAPNIDDAVLEGGEYVHGVGEGLALLQFASPPGGPAADWRLLAQAGGGTTAIPCAFPAPPGALSRAVRPHALLTPA